MATTGGTGGPLTNGVSGWWADTNGYSSKYRWWAAHIDTAKPIGIFVWFHGDGAYEYNNPTNTAYIGGPDGILQACIEQNMILVVPLTPDDDGVLTWWEWGSKTGNTQWAKEMIHANFYDKYDIDRGKIWFGGFSGGAEFLTAQFLPHWGNDLLIEAGGAVITGGGTFHSDYGGDPTFDPTYKANFRMYWRTGEDDTAANSSEGFDGVIAAQTGEAWYRNKGFPTDIALIPGKSHLLDGLYGGYIREALAATGGPAQSGVYIGSQSVIGMFVGSTPVTAVYVGTQKVWPTRDVVQITLGAGTQARDQFRAALTERGLDYTTITEVPFEIELVGSGSTQNMFYGCAALTSAPAMDTAQVTDMRYMFRGCPALTSVSDMDTSSVTTMDQMFYECSDLTHVPDMDTSSVTTMRYMFYNCAALTSAPSMDTAQVTDMGNMFRGCPSLTYVPDMDTAQVTDMRYMFYNCAALTDGNVRLIGRHPQVDTTGMIGGSGLTKEPFVDMVRITLGTGFNTQRRFRSALSDRGLNYQTVEELPFGIELVGTGSAEAMFRDCAALTRLPPMNTRGVTSMRSMFYDCVSLTTVPPMNTSQVTEMTWMFNGCSSLTSVPAMITSNVTSMRAMFQSCSSLKSVPDMDTSRVTETGYMFRGCSSLTSVPDMDTSKVTNMINMFYDCSALTSVPDMNTSQVTDMRWMFYGCSSLTSVPDMDTSKVTNMYSMFNTCSALTSVPDMDTSQVTDMSYMFRGCSSLTSVPDMDTSKVLNMTNMFYDCSALTSVPDMNTTQVTEMTWMFNGCSSLTSVPAMITSNVTSMRAMFQSCSSLTTVPAMDTSKVTNMVSMFNTCSSLTYVPDLQASNVEDVTNMFRNCISLTDGNVRLIGRHPNVDTTDMIINSSLTLEPFYLPDDTPDDGPPLGPGR